MARVCDICGKKPITGTHIVRKGLEKKKGGIGLHTTGISKRRFKPNLQSVRMLENGGVVRRRICTACLKSGNIVKP